MQASTRYIDYSKQFNYITPKSIQENEYALVHWENTMEAIQKGMDSMKELGVPIEDFTNALPIAYSTKMILKINLRALIHMFHVRSCTCAYLEYRELMKELKKEIFMLEDEEWVFLAKEYFVPKCIASGYCDEITRCCGIRPIKKECNSL